MIPVGATLELIEQGRHTLSELATAAGRDPSSIDIIAYLVPADRQHLQALANAGTDTAIIRLASEPEAVALAELARVANEVLYT